jgi:hypothetical protein
MLPAPNAPLAQQRSTIYKGGSAMSSRAVLTLALAMLTAPGLAAAQPDCPAAVKDAVQKAHSSSRMTSCKQEKEKGKIQYEVKIMTKEETHLELDVSPEGAILLTEEVVATGSVPKAVMAAFDAKYAKKKVDRAEKQTHADGTVTYEVAFKDARGKKHEATFKEDGAFVEEE